MFSRPLALLLLLIALFMPARAYWQDSGDQTEIAKLLDQALSAPTPEEQIAIYRKILEIDPSNQNAFNGIRLAQQQIEQRKKERDQQDAASKKQEQQELQRSEAIRHADQAVASGDLKTARAALDSLRRVAPDDPNVARIEADVQSLASYQKLTWLGIGGAAVLLAAGVTFAVAYLRRQNTPYLEVIQGVEPGRRYLLEKDVTLMGSAEKFEDLPNHIVLRDDDGRIAKAHCEIHRMNKKLYVIDCYSKEGTFVDNKKVDPPEKPVRLRSGARLSLGGVETLKVGFTRKKT